MIKIFLTLGLSLFVTLSITAQTKKTPKFKFLANCNVNGKEIKAVHVHDITYDTMAFCDTGKDLMANSKKDRFVKKCNEKAGSATAAGTTFTLYCTQE